MNKLASAMQEAGIVTGEDVERVTEEQAEERADRLLVLRMDFAMRRFPLTLAEEMMSWMEIHDQLIPVDVLERWASVDMHVDGINGVKREWSKWLCAWMEVEGSGDQ